jgi:HEAT repeat protein
MLDASSRARALAGRARLCDVRGVRLGVGIVLCVSALAVGCGKVDEPTTEIDRRYVLEVDLGPTIKQLAAEEQADIDEATERLASFGDPVVPVLERALATEPDPIKLAIIDALSQIDTAPAFTALIAVGRHATDPEVRATALLRLGENGWAPARPALEAALGDPSPMVAQTAAIACGALCTTPAAIDTIIDMALRDMADVELGRVRVSIGRLLAGPDQAAATHARETIQRRTAPILASTAPLEARTRAALLAADAGVPDVEPVLLAAARDGENGMLRIAAITWLGKSGGPAGIPVLEAGLQDRNTAQAAALALQAASGRGVQEAKDALARFSASRPRQATN